MSARQQALDAAALQLLTAEADSTQRHAICELLAPIAGDPSEPSWLRDALTTAIALLEQIDSGAAEADGTLRRVATLLELASQGEPAPSPARPLDMFGELLPQFVAESIDSLDQAERALLELEANPAAADAIDVVFRAFHTIKSTSAFFGLDAISNRAHDMESELCPVRDGDTAFSQAIANRVLLSADSMRSLLNALIAPAPHAASPTTALDTDRWVRVRAERLDQLLDMVGELVVAHSMLSADTAVQQERHGVLARKLQQTSKIVRELQGLSLSLRMVPLRPLFQKLRRLVRDLSQSTDKPVELVLDGEDTELDRHMVEALGDPLVHMIRNAIDHGIESAAERLAAGKAATATLNLSAWHEGGSVIVELSDDGRGLDHARIVSAAVAKGIVAESDNLPAAEINDLIFKPGFSTSSEVTELSGRGVGMDVVRQNIGAMSGRIDIASASGKGTTFTIRVPLTRAITDGMLVRVGDERYIVPTVEIQTSFRPRPDSLVKAGSEGELVMLHGKALPVVRLHHVLSVGSAETDPARALLIVLGEAEARYALLVDDLLGQQQFVAKPVAAGSGAVPGIAGGAILADGRVGLILDPGGVLAAARRMPAWRGNGSVLAGRGNRERRANVDASVTK
jgi:two-component system, chemotaxis family, sensor kinase CheA